VLQDGTAVTTGSSRAPGKRTRTKNPPTVRLPGPRPSNEGRQRTEEEDGRGIQESKRALQRRFRRASRHTGDPLQRDRKVTREQGLRGRENRRRPPRPRDGRGEERREAERTRGDPRTHHHRSSTPPRTRETGTSGDTSRFFPRVDFGLF
jgi:hypothetical protein